MLSIEIPSDPSCSSSRDSALRSDERDSDHGFVSQFEPQPPNFSIRDYVFNSRSKDIRTNWPFPEQLLKLCLDNGIRDILPPFESPELVRAQHFKVGVESNKLARFSEIEPILSNEEPISITTESCLPSDQLQEEEKLEVYQEGILGGKVIGIEADQIEPSEKECPFVAKSDIATKNSGQEDLASNLSTVSDTMAAKVCPVCKTFTSTSNTALNAHIDRCLSSECSIRKDATKFSKHKVKQMKTRLMVDIYAAAPYCTLEELDRRNGTNWATELSLAAPGNENTHETKRLKLSPRDSIDDGNEGEVYVDSNGTKMRILSHLNDPPPLMPRKHCKVKKHEKDLKADGSCLITKKRSFKSKHSKYVDVNQESKKLSSSTLQKGEIQVTPEEDCSTVTHKQKEESLSQLLAAQDQHKGSKPATLGQWVCSKRTHLARKINKKDIHKRSMEKYQLHSGNSSLEGSHVSELSRVLDASSYPQTKNVDVLSNDAKPMDGRKNFPKSSNLNSRLLGEGYSSADSLAPKIECPIEDHTLLLKAGESLSSEESLLWKGPSFALEAKKGDKSENLSTTKKFGRWSDQGLHSNVEGDTSSKSHQSNISENQEGNLGVMKPVRSAVTIEPVSDKISDTSPSSKEHVESISITETQRDPSAQRSTCDQEMQCGNVIVNEIINQNIRTTDEGEHIIHYGELQIDIASFQDVGLETVQENTSLTSVRAKSIQVPNLINDKESSGSPVSTTSNISPCHKDYIFKNSEAKQPTNSTTVQYKSSSTLERKDHKVKMSPLAKEPCCSCSQSLSRESHLLRQVGRPIASHNSFIGPPTLSSQAYSSLESPTESVLAKSSSEFAAEIQSPCSQAQSQANSNPILRLMGKDLVVRADESMHSDYSPKIKYLSFGVSNHISFNYNHNFNVPRCPPSIDKHQIPLQPRRRRLIKKSNCPPQCSVERMHSPHPFRPKPTMPSSQALHPTNDVNGSPIDHPSVMPPQRPFSCFPLQSSFASKAVNSRKRVSSKAPFKDLFV